MLGGNMVAIRIFVFDSKVLASIRVTSALVPAFFSATQLLNLEQGKERK